MTEHEMLEAEKYWCENCCNWDKEEVQMDACSTCKLTGTRVFAQESGKECKCFNVPAENVIVPPCNVGDVVYQICFGKLTGQRIIKQSKVTAIKITDKLTITLDYTTNLYDTDIGYWLFVGENAREEAEQALKGGAE